MIEDAFEIVWLSMVFVILLFCGSRWWCMYKAKTYSCSKFYLLFLTLRCWNNSPMN